MEALTPEARAKGLQARREVRMTINAAPRGDNVENKVPGKLKWCRWGVPQTHTTRNISMICDTCWSRKSLSEKLALGRLTYRPRITELDVGFT